MDDYLSKPLRAADLDAALERWIHSLGPVVIDRTVLRGLAQDLGDDSIVEDICDLFLSEVGPRLETMRGALEARDTQALRTAAHTLKGSAANVGAVAVSSAAAEVEILAGAGELDAARAPLTRLGDAVTLTRAALGRSAA
jgi:HPt (histidine-containing phosphotransfer) domain-containing protein